ncbi:NB-ARC domain-containing protein [Mycena venus]|uniref:NB-ARC domain-containing protein n=1 Tax=Mycena venus TaxID=2733690 RepID=A0A8H6YG24_9AGAR|nr:NB-ARC domain-containing protein [Mycena venus]
MPRDTRKPDVQSHGNQILERTATAARLLLNISDDDSAKNPFLKGIAGISILLLEMVQTVKANKSQCLDMLEQIHEIIFAIINILSDGSVLPPTVLHSLSEFFDTLQKVHAFVRSQVDFSLFRRVLRYSETTALLEDCNVGLQHAIDVFGIRSGLSMTTILADFKEKTEMHHEELMELLQQANSTRSTFSLYESSSDSSLCLLPSSPQIFHGRDGELEELVKKLLELEPFRAVILGPGGIGKSSLALAVLHHREVQSHFGAYRHFISLESSSSASDMISTIAAFFGIEESPKLSKAIVRYLADLATPCVIVLDNLEDCWEAVSSRSDVEDFLSLLSEIPHLQLLVTMRGAERPGKVKWTRPFLPALDPLDDEAARQTFLDIADEVDGGELTALLALTDNLPLAITLMANLTSFEGGESVLKRWASETTSLLSEGFNKRANLDKSIMISLSSPRMLASPHARELLSLIKSTLLRCSLIYPSADGRLRTLAPIRQYVAERFPPGAHSFNALRAYFYELASLFRVPTDLPNRELIQRLSVEFANVRAVTTHALARSLHLADTVRCAIDLMHFNASSKSAPYELPDAVHQAVEHMGDLLVKGDYLLAQARITVGRPPCLPLTTEALKCFEEKNDAFGQVRALYTLASHLSLVGKFQESIETAERGARLAEKLGNLSMQALCMNASAEAYRNMGDLRMALIYGHGARRLSQASGNMTAEAWVTQEYASCLVTVGDYAGGADLCAVNTSLLSALGIAHLDVHAYRNVLNVSAEIFDRRTEYEAAHALRIRIYNARRAIDDMPKAWDLVNIGLIEIELGDLSSARRRVEAAQRAVSPAIHKAAGLDIISQIIIGDLDFHNGDYEGARKGLQNALAQTGWMDLGMMAMERLSNVALKTNDMHSAMRYSVLLLVSSKKTQDLAATHQSIRRLGDISLASGDKMTAMNLFQVALDGKYNQHKWSLYWG